MSALCGLPVLTAAQTRAAEDALIAAGTDLDTLIARAGAGVARWTARLAAGASVLVVCGPGRNGADGYVAARLLRAEGVDVRVAALAPPADAATVRAAAHWGAPVVALADAAPSTVLVDALFGTGANRPVPRAERIATLAAAAALRIAVDLPSGLDTDSGAGHGRVGACDLTLALGVLKPAHVLQPGAALCGEVRLIDIGLALAGAPPVRVLHRPSLAPPPRDAHKYTRGHVAVIVGAMPGAARLSATAALRAGAGYATLLGGTGEAGPAALVRRPLGLESLQDRRLTALVIGPGLGRDAAARAALDQALASSAQLVIDGDALRLLDPDAVPPASVLTPHAGEFDALFGSDVGSKLARTLAAAARSGAVVVHKGPDTVVAAPDGRAGLLPGASSWLATAGSGDVLTGAIAARLRDCDPFAAACDGVWMHARAAALLGGGLIADDLSAALGMVRAGA